jgi:hypothetical protein
MEFDLVNQITDAVKELERQETYRDAGVASIHDTLETLILGKPAMAVLQNQPVLSTKILLSRLSELPSRLPDFPRIGFFVALGHLGQRAALPALAAYLSGLSDEAQVHHIGHPFRYALRAIEHITGTSLGLGPQEDLESLLKQRYEISSWLLHNEQ